MWDVDATCWWADHVDSKCLSAPGCESTLDSRLVCVLLSFVGGLPVELLRATHGLPP